MIPQRKLTPKKLRDAVITVLSSGCYRQSATALAEAIAQADGLNRAADIIEKSLNIMRF